MDYGSFHRGAKCGQRPCRRWPSLIPVRTPVHASWLDEAKIDFSVVERKVPTPNDFASRRKLRVRLLRFQEHHERVERPFQWKFTRKDLAGLLRNLEDHCRKLTEVS